ncbi:hypothetical protein VRC02_05955 [Erwinia sp. E_sp_B01_3]
MRKHVDYTGTHKIITRDQYLKSLHPSIAAKLKWILEENKPKGKGK